MSIRHLAHEARARKRSSPQHKSVIRSLGGTWLYIEGYPERIPREFGDNLGAWPHRIKLTSTGPLTASSKTQYEDPIHERNVVASWHDTIEREAKAVEQRIRAILEQHDVPLRKGWYDIEPDKIVQIVEWAAMVENAEHLRTEREYWALVDFEYDQRARKRAAG